MIMLTEKEKKRNPVYAGKNLKMAESVKPG